MPGPHAAYRYSASPAARQSTGGPWRMTDASRWPALPPIEDAPPAEGGGSGPDPSSQAVLMRCQVIRLLARSGHALSSEALNLEIVVPFQDRNTSAATGVADASAIKTDPSPARITDSHSMRKKRRGWIGTPNRRRVRRWSR